MDKVSKETLTEIIKKAKKSIVILEDFSFSVSSAEPGIAGFAFNDDGVTVWIKDKDSFSCSKLELDKIQDFYLHPTLAGMGKKLREWLRE